MTDHHNNINADRALMQCEGMSYIQAGIFDLNGQLRGKRLPVSYASKLLTSGFNIPVSVQNLDLTGADIHNSRFVFDSGDQDGRAMWTGTDPIVMSHLTEPSALFLMSMHDQNEHPFEGCPRAALQMLISNAQQKGFYFTCGFELEFTLLDKNAQPFATQTDILSLLALDSLDEFFSAVQSSCSASDIWFESLQSEAGPGQFEIVMMADADIVRAADRVMLLRHLLVSYAHRFGMIASMKAKPYRESAGNGMHVHLSAQDSSGKNIFAKDETYLHFAIAGVLACLQEASLVFAPTVNSFQRLTPYSHAPVSLCWGYDNRTVAVRVPVSTPSARRLELRLAGMDANPYLILLSAIYAILSGIEAQKAPPAPVQGNSYDGQHPRFPEDFNTALELFRNSEIMQKIFPPVLHEMFVSCKEQDGQIGAEF